jgi:hypothetical protein
MSVDLFACLYVSDRDAVQPWYEQLLGAEPSMFPNDIEAVFDLDEHRYLYIEQSAEHAGHCQVTLFVSDFDERIAGITGRGLAPDTEETYDNGVRKTTYVDPDGNRIGVGGAPVAT